jgi:hypothetical protein
MAPAATPMGTGLAAETQAHPLWPAFKDWFRRTHAGAQYAAWEHTLWLAYLAGHDRGEFAGRRWAEAAAAGVIAENERLRQAQEEYVLHWERELAAAVKAEVERLRKTAPPAG